MLAKPSANQFPLRSRRAKKIIRVMASLCAVLRVCGQEKQPELAHPKFLGAQSCSSSSCHGGAGDNRHHYTVWSKLDFHSRSYSTLTTARSARIAEALKIGDPAQNARCTVCHAPFQTVPASQLDKNIDVKEGVSCGSCHGPAEHWLRSHTRLDFSHSDRVNAGMRDLKNLYVRANTCVACHQNVDGDLLQAGHPELIFELDGQAVTQPKHWHEMTNWNGAKAWLVGQAVALREMSWQFEREKTPSENVAKRWAGLVWLLHEAGAVDRRFPAVPAGTFSPTANDLTRVRDGCDQLARSAATMEWQPALTRKWLNALAGKADAFDGKTFSPELQARQAERLVLALDRLVTALPELDKNEPTQTALKHLFNDAQSVPDFNPAQFAAHLKELQKTVASSSTEANKLKTAK